LTEHNRIEKTQCSFTENHSTELAITAICDELLSNFDKELITCSLFFIFFYFWSYWRRFTIFGLTEGVLLL